MRRTNPSPRLTGSLAAGLALLLAAAASAAAPPATIKVLDGFDSARQRRGGPWSELVRGYDGRFYGVTCCSGPQEHGAIYSTDLQGRTRIEHTFTAAEGDAPNGGLAIGADGSLYGAAFAGGASGHGSLFRLGTDGRFEVLHSFDGADGDGPLGGLEMAADNAAYGTTSAGGRYGAGEVYRFVPATGEFSVVHAFAFDAGGSAPVGRLRELPDGGLVGVTMQGGAGGGGTVYRLSPGGAFSTFVAFDAGGQGPCAPREGLVLPGDGWMYGTSMGCGTAGKGTVYRASPDSHVQTLHSFLGAPADGATSTARLSIADDFHLYGVTREGGADDLGTVFRLSRGGDYELVHEFGLAEGTGPQSGLLEVGYGHFLGAAPHDGPAGFGATYLLKVHELLEKPGRQPLPH